MIITTHKKVTITIAVMTHNQPELIESLWQELNPFLEVIDNGSTIPIPHTSIRLEENNYFAGGWNKAMPFFDTTWVAMLNDDISGIRWQMIMDMIEKAEEEGYDAISPAFNSPHVHMQPHYHGQQLRQVTSIDWVAAIIKKRVWDEVSGFDTNFVGYGSDLDIAYRLRKKGYRLGVDDRFVIHHMGGTAALAAGTVGIQNNVAAMDEAFKKKYGASDWIDFTNRFLNMI